MPCKGAGVARWPWPRRDGRLSRVEERERVGTTLGRAGDIGAARVTCLGHGRDASGRRPVRSTAFGPSRIPSVSWRTALRLRRRWRRRVGSRSRHAVQNMPLIMRRDWIQRRGFLYQGMPDVAVRGASKRCARFGAHPNVSPADSTADSTKENDELPLTRTSGGGYAKADGSPVRKRGARQRRLD